MNKKMKEVLKGMGVGLVLVVIGVALLVVAEVIK